MSNNMRRDESTYAVLPFECNVFQSYIRGLKTWWKDDLYREVVQEAQTRDASGAAELESQMGAVPAYQLYAWLERHLQQFKYVGHWGLVPVLEADNKRLAAILEEGGRRFPERLQLDPDFVIPDYVKHADTHQHPGSTWSDDYDAFVHESATAGFSFTLGDSDQLVAQYGAPLMERFAPSRILDLGCATGKSSRAFKIAAPTAQVVGCDVSAPVLRLAHLRSVEQDLEITFKQQNAEHLAFEEGSFDLVASHWLFHELPTQAIRNVIREARRVLRRGGGFAIYDMCIAPGGVVGEWLHSGYSARNNEPYALALVKMDLKRELEEAGFEDVRFDLRVRDRDALASSRTNSMTMVTAVSG